MLGIGTVATIRLIRLLPFRASISASFREIEDAAEAVQQILKAGFLPSALEIADRFTLESARKHLGHQIVPAGNAHQLEDLDGQEKSVRNQSAVLESLVKKLGALGVGAAFGQAVCDALR